MDNQNALQVQDTDKLAEYVEQNVSMVQQYATARIQSAYVMATRAPRNIEEVVPTIDKDQPEAIGWALDAAHADFEQEAKDSTETTETDEPDPKWTEDAWAQEVRDSLAYAEDVDAPAPPLWASLLALIPGDRESRILALFVATVGCLLIAAILLTAHFAQKAGPPW